ncbi:TetR/AcrR family transcriptional regulator [Luteimicrobium xylanilyticum]|nr:TetR/AcrR family transcriptional regulator [Luteimicrobium xylanilyticum]
MAGLREQWRRSAMQTIQERALDLFDERGFAAVTIEQVAAAADVSPSSVYRYFGTKEGLLVADEFDSMDDGALAALLDPADPVGSMVRVVQRYEAPDDAEGSGATARRRVRYFFTEPSVRAAVCGVLDRAAGRVAPLLTAGGLTATQARVVAHAVAFGYFAALESWFDDGGQRPIAGYVEEGLAPLRRIWA